MPRPDRRGLQQFLFELIERSRVEPRELFRFEPREFFRVEYRERSAQR